MRVDSISIAKAFAIILMVLAHTMFSATGDRVINMFHMPVFFFFAGYCFKEEYINNFKSFAIKRIKGLYIPYVKYSILFLLLHNVFFYLNIYNDTFGWRGNVSYEYGLKDIVLRILHIITGMWGHEQLLGGFWFLGTLFWASFLAFFAIKIIKRHYVVVALFFILAMVASYFNKHVPVVGVGAKELTAALIFYIGYLSKKRNRMRISVWIYPISLLGVMLGARYWPMTLLNVTYWKVIPWTFTAILGTIGLFNFCRGLEKKEFLGKRFLIYIGDNTLSILTWHFLCFKIVSLFIIGIYQYPIRQLAEFPTIVECSKKGWWILYLFVGILFPIGFHFVLSKIKLFIRKK